MIRRRFKVPDSGNGSDTVRLKVTPEIGDVKEMWDLLGQLAVSLKPQERATLRFNESKTHMQ